MKKTAQTAPATPADPFATTHEAEGRAVFVTDSEVAPETLLLVDNSYRVIMKVQAIPATGQVYVEWMTMDIRVPKSGLMLEPNTRVTIRPRLPPPPPPREEMSFRQALSSGYYNTRLPYGTSGSVEREAYRQDQTRLDKEFLADLESEECVDKLPRSIRDAIYAASYEEGHSAGKSEVANCYPTFHDLALKAYEAGQQNPNRS